MSTIDSAAGTSGDGEVKFSSNGRSLHRLAAVRRLQGISRRTMARRLDVEIAEIRREEDEAYDLPLSRLYKWQKALEVPVSELLVESDDNLSLPLMQRAQLVRLTKTVLAILEQAEQETIRLMAQTLVDQLIEIMPELNGVSAWHTVGKRRRLDELGIAAQRALGDEAFVDLSD